MDNEETKPSVAIIMGSQSDWETMKFSEEILIKLNIPFITWEKIQASPPSYCLEGILSSDGELLFVDMFFIWDFLLVNNTEVAVLIGFGL